MIRIPTHSARSSGWHFAIAIAVAFELVSPCARARELVFECGQSSGVRVLIDENLEPQLRVGIELACNHLSRDGALDSRVTLQISARGAEADLEALLPDGRRATRRIRDAKQMGLAIKALVTLPSAEPSALARQADQSHSALTPSASALPPPARSSTVTEARLAFELGAAAGFHVAGSSVLLSPSLNAYTGLTPGDWVSAVMIRWDPVQVQTRGNAGGAEMDSAGLGFVLLRRSRFGAARLDTGLCAAFLLETQSYEGDDGEHAVSQGDFRFGAVSRALLGRQNPRWTLSVEANVSPARLRRAVRMAPVLPALPAWELGAAVGTTWSGL